MGAFEEIVLVRFKADGKELEKTLKEAKGNWVAAGKTINKTTGEFKKQFVRIKEGGKEYKTVTKQLKGFRMELLSVMFAGMAMERVFGAQISRMSQLVGIGPQVEAFYTLSLLEPMIAIEKELVGPLFNAFTNLPQSWQTGIGWGMITVTGIGMTLSVFGQAYLGILGLERLLATTLPKSLGTAGASFGLFGSTASKALTGLGFSLAGGLWTLALAALVYFSYKDYQQTLDRINEIKAAAASVSVPGQGLQLPQDVRMKSGMVGKETIMSSGPKVDYSKYVTKESVSYALNQPTGVGSPLYGSPEFQKQQWENVVKALATNSTMQYR